MPNWCSNRLVVSGPITELVRFWDELSPNVVSGSERAWDDKLNLLSTFVPMPEKYENTVEGSDTVTADDGLTWYSWAVANWGCKWPDCEGTVVERTDERIVMDFTTPWCPPVEGIQKLSELFPDLAFVCGWHEAGMAETGQFWFPEDADPEDADPDELTLVDEQEETEEGEGEDEDYTYTSYSFPELNGHVGFGSG